MPNLPGPGPVEYHPTESLLPLLGEHTSLAIGKVRGKAYHLAVFLSAEALSASKIPDCFQQIGFSLGVVTHDQIHTRVKVQRKLLIIPEIP